MKAIRHSSWFIVLLGLSLSFAGCSCGDDESANPEILSFTASNSEIEEGGSTTLAWQTSGAVAVNLADAEGNEIDIGEAGVDSGAVEVTLTESTTFVLTATGEARSEPVQATVSVTVLEPGEPAIVAFTADPQIIVEGGSVTLAWETLQAESVSISDHLGQTVNIGEEVPEAGSVLVEPAVDTVYTLTAVGSGGSVDADVSVTVLMMGKILAFDVDDEGPVLPGTEVTLSWDTEDASSITILAGDAVLLQSENELSGSMDLEVEVTSVFTLRADGPGGNSEADLTVLVLPYIDSFSATPSEVRPGDEVVLAWRVRGALEGSIVGPDEFSIEIEEADLAEGHVALALTEGGTFVLSAISGELEQTMSATVVVTERPLIRDFSSSSEAITSGEQITLSWVIDGEESIELSADPGGVVLLNSDDIAAFSKTLSPAVSTIYTLRAVNSEGEDSRTLPVAVHPVPEITFFEAAPSRVASGSEVVLGWSTVDSVAVRLLKEGTDLQIDSGDTSGSHVDTVFVDTIYTLVAENMVGHSVEAEVEVSVGGALVISFAVEPDAVFPGETTEFSWTTTGGDSLIIRDPQGEIVCETTVVEETLAGVCSLPALLDGDYTLTVENDDGPGSAVTHLVVTDGPIVRTLAASPNPASAGESVTISWVVDGNLDPEIAHTLVLQDGEGNEIDLGDADVFSGSALVTVGEAGVETFTLTAATEENSHARSVDVEVMPLPMILVFTADPDSLDTQGGTVQPVSTLSWEVEGAVEIVLWEMSDEGVPVVPALLESSDPAVMASGSFDVSPSANAIYRLIALNSLGGGVNADVMVFVDLPEIDLFTITRVLDGSTGTHADILVGEEVTLTWDSPLADFVTLSPLPPGVTEYEPGTDPATGGYIDLSQRPTATQLTLEVTWGRGNAVFSFPDGFLFPYYGIRYPSVQVTSHGYLTLDAGAALPTSATDTFCRIPHPTTGMNGVSAMIAPFCAAFDVRQGPSEIWWELLEEDGERVIAIQWKGFNFSSTLRRVADLNFMVKLRENGVIEYHYGPMLHDDPDRQHFSDGSAAGIALQDHTRRHGYTWWHGSDEGGPVPGGLTGRSLIFDFRRPSAGSADYTLVSAFPQVRTKDFVLTSFNDNGVQNAHTAATRWRDLSDDTQWFASNFTVTAPPPETDEFEVGDEVEIYWWINDAVEAYVTESGQPLPGCASTGDFRADGTCTFVVDQAREWEFVLHVSNPASSGSRAIPVEVIEILRINDFATSATHIDGGDSVSLSWQAQGATSAEIQVSALGGSLSVLPIAPADLDQGQMVITPDETADYTLRIEDSATGRVRTESLSVYVDPARVVSLETTDTQVAAGDPVDLSWEVEHADAVYFYPPNPEWGGSPFVDIRPLGGIELTEWTGSDWGDNKSTFLSLDSNEFSFPFDGQNRSEFTIATNGYMTFDHSAAVSSLPRQVLPSEPTTSAAMHSVIAPYWVNLNREDTGEAHYLVVEGDEATPDHLIVQWGNFQLGRDLWNPANLDFQVVLFADGNMEFRYGEMSTTKEDHEHRVRGHFVTIGWQNFSMNGGMYPKEWASEVPGGLQDRSMKVPSGDIGSGWTVHPDATTEYTVCAEGNGWVDCQTVTVVVVEPGYLMFSELMVDAPSVADGMGEWFEVRNTSAYDVDLAGWTFESVGETFSLPADQPIVLSPGGFLVLARGGPTVNGGFQPDFVYGAAAPDFALDPIAGGLAMHYGDLLVDSFEWDSAAWDIVPDKSLTLDGIRLRGSTLDNESPDDWCESRESYGTGLFGSPGFLGRGCAHQLYDVDPAGANWIEIRETGTKIEEITSSVFGNTRMMPDGLDFEMPFFDGNYTDLWISANGWLSFNSTTSTFANFGTRTIPSTTNPTNLIAPYWSNLRADHDEVGVYYEIRTINGSKVAIVQWTNMMVSATIRGELTFQVQLWENGDIATVVHTAESADHPDSFNGGYYNGLRRTVLGIMNDGGTDGLEYSNNEAVIGPQTRIMYRRSPLP